jgi:signal transduction histidine kinase
LAAVDRALDRMERLIDDLLVLAREGEATGETEPAPLDEFVGECWSTVDTQQATLHLDSDLTVRADRGRLAQVFENLFRNAIEHGDDDASIRVGELEDGDGFFVEDDGPGIPEDERDEVFESGYSTSSGGTGVGLAIVRRIVEAHGWNVTVTEGTDGGARFEITDVESIEG